MVNSKTSMPSGALSDTSSDKNLQFGFALAAASVLFAPFLVDALHSGPAADDFCYAAQYDKSGFLGAIAHYYNNVNGRFFATFVIVTLDRIFPIELAYTAIPLVFLTSIALGFVAFVWALVEALAPRALDWRGKTALGLLSALVLIANTKNISEIFFWLSASATYVSAVTGTLIALACMLVIMRPDIGAHIRPSLIVVGALAAVAAVGSFEATGPVIIASAAVSAVVAYILKHRGIAGMAAIAVAAALGLWLNLTSPGTATRAAVIGVDASKDLIGLIAIAIRTVLWTTERIGLWGSQASVWLLAFAIFWVFRDRLAVEWKSDTRRRRTIIIVLLYLFALPYLAASPMFYAYSSANPIRAQFLVDVFCLFFWLAAMPFAFARFGKTLSIDTSGVDCSRVSAWLFAALFISIAGTGNFSNAFVDMLRGQLFTKDVAGQIRDVLEHPNRAREVVRVRTIDANAPTLFVADLGADPRLWRNLCFAEFLGAYGVRVEPDESLRNWPKSQRTIRAKGWVDPDPQAIGRPRPVWAPE